MIKGTAGIKPALGEIECDWTLGSLVIHGVTTLIVGEDIPFIMGRNLLRHPALRWWCMTEEELKLVLHNGDQCSLPLTTDLTSTTTTTQLAFTADTSVTPSDLTSKLKWLKSHLPDLAPLEMDNDEHTEALADLIIDNHEIFGGPDDLGAFPYPVSINTAGDPVSVRQTTIAKSHRDIVDSEIERMMALGVIRHCDDSGGWNTPLLMITKADGRPRMVANFRASLNKRLTKPEPFLIPSCDELMREAQPRCTMFSQMDMCMGYWQMPIRKEDQQKTSFQWRNQTYCYQRLPMGFKESGGIFARSVHRALSQANLDPSRILVYLDDISIIDNSITSFLLAHKQVFECLKKHNLRLKQSKCIFGRKSIRFLGRILSVEGIRADPSMVESIQLIKPPETKRQCQQLIGRLSYLRSFASVKMSEEVKTCNFAHLAEPIYQCGREQPFKWTSGANRALNKIKSRLQSAPFISLPDPSLQYVVVTDASDIALGGCLMQITEPGKYNICAIISKCFNRTERNWSATEKEAYALLYTCEKFESLIIGNTVIVKTDHKSLCYLDQKVFKNMKLSRWSERLARFDLIVQYLPGDQNVLCDWWSRLSSNNDQPLEFDSSPSGRFFTIRNTPMKVYIPSWCNHMIENGKTGKHVDIVETEPDNHMRAMAAFACHKTLVNTHLAHEAVELARSQREDILLQAVITAIKRGDDLKIALKKSNDERVTEIVKCKAELDICPGTDLLVRKSDNRTRVVVPDNQVAKYIRTVHDDSCHPGFDIAYAKLHNFWWPLMHTELKEYIRSCNHCWTIKGRQGLKKPLIGVNEKGLTPFSCIYVDFISLPLVSGQKYALTVIDSFSRFIRVYPSRGCSASDASIGLTAYINELGKIPESVHSDQGRHFVGEAFQLTLKALGSRHRKHVAFRPTSSALVERMHRSLKTALFVTADDLNKSWLSILPRVVSCLNSHINRSIQISPFECVYGRKHDYNLLSIEPDMPDKPHSYGKELKQQIKSIHDTVRKINQEVDFENANERRVNAEIVEYEQGDPVLVWRPFSTLKKSKKQDWIGPAKIVEGYEFIVRIEWEDGKTETVSRCHVKPLPKRNKKYEVDEDCFDELVIVYTEPEQTKTPDINPEPNISSGGGGTLIRHDKIIVKTEPVEKLEIKLEAKVEGQETEEDTDVTPVQTPTETTIGVTGDKHNTTDDVEEVTFDLEPEPPKSFHFEPDLPKPEAEHDPKAEHELDAVDKVEPDADEEVEPDADEEDEPDADEIDEPNADEEVEPEPEKKPKKKKKSLDPIQSTRSSRLLAESRRRRTKSEVEKEERVAKQLVKTTTVVTKRMAPPVVTRAGRESKRPDHFQS